MENPAGTAGICVEFRYSAWKMEVVEALQMRYRFFLSVMLAVCILLGILPIARAESAAPLSEEQTNAIAMLNYITVLTQDVNASKNSRLYMEEAYSSLINNTYPSAVDSRTLSQLTSLLDVMEGYRMIAVKRDRLQYIYEQNQAQAIRAIVPDPLGLLSTVQSYRASKIAVSLAYMALDSITSYTTYMAEIDRQYLTDGWALDDEEAAALHESRKGIFAYMISMVGEYDLPGDWTLTESNVEDLLNGKIMPTRSPHSISGIQSENLSILRRILAGCWRRAIMKMGNIPSDLEPFALTKA